MEHRQSCVTDTAFADLPGSLCSCIFIYFGQEVTYVVLSLLIGIISFAGEQGWQELLTGSWSRAICLNGGCQSDSQAPQPQTIPTGLNGLLWL